MKVLAGELVETVYETPGQETSKTSPLVIKSESRHQTNDVTYISDDIGLHRVHNPSTDQIAVSLHCTYTHETRQLEFLLTDDLLSIYTPQRSRLWISHLRRNHGQG